MSKDQYTQWFFDGAYYVAVGRPKMEDDLMSYARHEYLHCLVYDTYLPQIVKELQYKQELLWSQNKRLKRVEISLSKNDGSSVRWLHIGAQHLTLQRVKSEISFA